MKIDMSAKAITNRLKAVDQLRKVSLSLANSSAGRRIKEDQAAKSNRKEIEVDKTY